MKTAPKPAWKAGVMLWTALVLLPLGAEAGASRARRAEGKVLVVDRETQTILVKPPSGKRPLLVDWNKHTWFIHNGRVTNAVALTEGVRVAVFYHSPLFSKPFVTKVVWSNGR